MNKGRVQPHRTGCTRPLYNSLSPGWLITLSHNLMVHNESRPLHSRIDTDIPSFFSLRFFFLCFAVKSFIFHSLPQDINFISNSRSFPLGRYMHSPFSPRASSALGCASWNELRMIYSIFPFSIKVELSSLQFTSIWKIP